ncbi:MAG: GIY-YIG nuclease family protein [Dehalococcoidia bacterium]|nr:GIY-YIG nuclease family protein [Dehalococcoidia bacterium]
MGFYVYMLQCADGSIYKGHTDNLEARLAGHRMRVFSGYTASRLPVRLIFQEVFATRDEAFSRERQIKGWSRRKKLALATGDWATVQRLSSAHGSTSSP